jgi:hypothetical protein
MNLEDKAFLRSPAVNSKILSFTFPWVTSVTWTSGGGGLTGCFLAFPSQATVKRRANPKGART